MLKLKVSGLCLSLGLTLSALTIAVESSAMYLPSPSPVWNGGGFPMPFPQGPIIGMPNPLSNPYWNPYWSPYFNPYIGQWPGYPLVRQQERPRGLALGLNFNYSKWTSPFEESRKAAESLAKLEREEREERRREREERRREREERSAARGADQHTSAVPVKKVEVAKPAEKAPAPVPATGTVPGMTMKEIRPAHSK